MTAILLLDRDARISWASEAEHAAHVGKQPMDYAPDNREEVMQTLMRCMMGADAGRLAKLMIPNAAGGTDPCNAEFLRLPAGTYSALMTLRAIPKPLRNLDKVSPRERQVLRLVASGLSTKGIAAQLGIARSTVETLFSNARSRLGIRDRDELVARLVENREFI